MKGEKFTQEQKEDENILFIYETIKEMLKTIFDLEITRPAEAVILKKVIREVANEGWEIKELKKTKAEIEDINSLLESIDRFFKDAYGVDIYQYKFGIEKAFPGIRIQSFGEKLEKLGGMSLGQRLGKMIKEEREKRELI